jgi:hypothetical protein
MDGLRITVQAGRLELDKKHVRTVLRRAGNEIAGAARSLIRQSAGSGRVYWYHGSSGGHGRYRASAPGQAPVSLSGKLASSIKVLLFRSGEGVAVRDAVFYALMLEKGAKGGGGDTREHNLHYARTGSGKRRMNKSAIGQTRVLAPRPFLSIALDQRRASLERRVGEAISTGLKMRRATKRELRSGQT